MKGNRSSAGAAPGRKADPPLARLAVWSRPTGRADPVALLRSQEADRVPGLAGLRYQRMLVSPFSFLRGAAIVMANDLATKPVTGLLVQASGDAHLSNFGLYGTPERRLIFDVNDFDETLVAPWEWDILRLATSFVVAGRAYNHSRSNCEAAALAAAASYRKHMRHMASLGHLEVWYARVNATAVASILAPTRKGAKRVILRTKSESSVHEEALLTRLVDGQPHFIDKPPAQEHITSGETPETWGGMQEMLAGYGRSVDPQVSVLLSRYRLVDAVRKVVGVGSVGTRCAVGLLVGANPGDPLFLQVKQAVPSVLEAVAGPSPFANQAERVVRGQRLCQAASDLFLGWVRAPDGRDYYVRQRQDMKWSVDPESLSDAQLIDYAKACGWVLARAHARSGDPAAIAAYLGGGNRFERAVTEFAAAYAEQTESDFAELRKAAKAGEIPVARP